MSSPLPSGSSFRVVILPLGPCSPALRAVRWFAAFVGFGCLVCHEARTDGFLLPASPLASFSERFGALDEEREIHAVSNADAATWMEANIPRFTCPDREIEEIYHFRWWAFRKHLRRTAEGFVITEFLAPVRHAGPNNTISCALGHHLAEGRWIRDPRYVEDTLRFWLRGHGGGPQPHLHAYSGWLAAAVLNLVQVRGNQSAAFGFLEDLVADFFAWERERLLPDGLYWQFDVRDGMEESISGSRRERQARPTINSYQYGNARALARLARRAGKEALALDFDRKADTLRARVQQHLWDPDARFFKVRRADGTLADVREAIGFLPWLFDLPEPGRGFESAWAQFADPSGFRAPYGLTTAERRDRRFRSHGCCGCEWDGAVWPFATSQTLTALAGVLRRAPLASLGQAGPPVSREDYWEAFLTYTRSHRFDGEPYLGEYQDETTGQWLKGRQERSRYYNHSTYADLLITGAIGLVPREDDLLVVDPLLPAGTWDWFCLDGVTYHGRMITLLWDRDGTRFGRGAGFQAWVDGRRFLRAEGLGRIEGTLP